MAWFSWYLKFQQNFVKKQQIHPKKKIYWQNWPQIWGSFGHLLSKKFKKNFFVKFWQILAQISKKIGILKIGSRTCKITASGLSPTCLDPPQDPPNGLPNTKWPKLWSHKTYIKSWKMRPTLMLTVRIITNVIIWHGKTYNGPKVYVGNWREFFYGE